MKNAVWLLLAVIGLYLVLSIGLHAVYGPSYPFPPSSDCWRPDGSGGWTAIGKPLDPPPDTPSQQVPVLVSYIPLLVPGLLLVLFLFTPLSRLLDGKPKQPEPEEAAESESSPGAVDEDDTEDSFSDDDAEPELPRES